VRREAHRLGPHPAALHAVAMEQPQDSRVRTAALGNGRLGRPWLRSLFPPPINSNPARLQTLTGHASDVNAVAVTPDGRHAVSASWDRTLIVWDLASGTAQRRLAGHTKAVHAVAVTPDGRHAVSASADGTLIVWDLASGTAQRRLGEHTHNVFAV